MQAATPISTNKEIFEFIFPSLDHVRIRGIRKNRTSSKDADPSIRTFTFSTYVRAEDGYDLYYPPNGDFRKSEVRSFRAFWVDFDAPKIGGCYPDLDTSINFKKDCIERLNSFPLRPTYITDTRNGLHVLWAIDATEETERWQSTLTSLSQYLDSDPRVNAPNQILRVPNSTWFKLSTGLPSYPIRCTEFNRVRYTLEEFEETLDVLDDHNTENARSNAEPDDSEFIGRGGVTKQPDVDDVVSRVLSGELASGTARRQLIELAIAETGTVASKSIICPFHSDESPSAKRFSSGAIYCHAEQKRYSAVEVIASKLDVSPVEAVVFCTEEFRIEAPLTSIDKLRLTVARIRENEERLPALIERAHPLFEKLCHSTSAGPVEVLRYLHDLTLQRFDINEVVDESGNPTIFAATRQIGDSLDIGRTKAKLILRLLALVGLIRPVPVRELPEAVTGRLKNWKLKRQYASVPFHIGIPDYSDARWREMFDDRLVRLAQVPIQHRLMTYDALTEFFGPEIAEYVYPEANWYAHANGHRRATEHRGRILDIIDQLVHEGGFAREVDVIDTFLHSTNYRRSRAEKEYKYNIEILLYLYPELCRRQLTKSEKRNLGVSWNWGKATIIAPSSTRELGCVDGD